MGHPQIIRYRIEDVDFTLYYDYDQLRDRKLSRLTDDGKIEWFRRRMDFVSLEPLRALYGGRTPAYRALNSTAPDDLPARSFVIATFSVLLNGIEALGSFLTSSRANQVRFCTFVEKYMQRWDQSIPNSPYGPLADMKKVLWKHFRNGIAHGFCVQGGGIDNEADRVGWQVVDGRLQIGPHAFFRDFTQGVDSFFRDAGGTQRTVFLDRFRRVYPH